MQMLSRDADRTARLACSAAFLCASLMLSLAESFIFPTGLLPIPGAKPGLANAVILLCSVILGRKYAGTVSLARVMLMFFLFGNGSSILYSLSGAVLSYVGIIVISGNRHLSFFGKSVITAILHNMAQVICAVIIFGFPAWTLFPWMILSAVLCGGFTGIVLNLCYNPITKAMSKRHRI